MAIFQSNIIDSALQRLQLLECYDKLAQENVVVCVFFFFAHKRLWNHNINICSKKMEGHKNASMLNKLLTLKNEWLACRESIVCLQQVYNLKNFYNI